MIQCFTINILRHNMKRILILFFVFIVQLYAVSKEQLAGHWQTVTQTNNNGLITIEKEYMNLNQNSTFSVIVLVSVQKGNAYLKDLRIEASGIWEVRDTVLVMVVKKVNVPIVQEVNQISEESINNLAENFKYKYENDPIHIITIKFLNTNSLITINEALRETSYSR